MPKTPASTRHKSAAIIRDFPTEFISTPTSELYCKLCSCIVKCEKRFFVEKHRASNKHKSRLEQSTSSSTFTQNFLSSTSTNDFATQVARAFVSADIPLWKLRNNQLRDLFAGIGHPLPSEQTCRLTIPNIYNDEIARIKALMAGKPIFLVVDESQVSGNLYLNILVGSVDKPQHTYLWDCVSLTKSPNADVVIHTVDDAINSLACARSNFNLLISDAARYMTSAAKTLHILYPKLFHITCCAHLLHNCAMKVRTHYDIVDQLIARVKAFTVKNRAHQALFDVIGSPPEPIVTRWASWLKAANYYCNNLPQVKEIVDNAEGTGLIVLRAKEVLSNENLSHQLVEIKTCYTELTTLEDPCGIREYLNQRLLSGELMSIVNLTRPDVSPSLYAQLLQCQPTSASVERSFSMLNKLLAKDRNFKPENVKKYLTLYFNKQPV